MRRICAQNRCARRKATYLTLPMWQAVINRCPAGVPAYTHDGAAAAGAGKGLGCPCGLGPRTLSFGLDKD